MDVSVIIPTYNRLWCLPAAIDSCRNTTCSTEIIVIDDGSTDGTWEWLNQQQGLTIARQEHMGKCWAVNYGYQLAKGKYIRFLDSDDRLEKNAIDEQFQLAQNTLSDVIVSGYKLIDQHGIVTKEQPWVECDDFVAQQLGECDGSHYSAFLFTKEILSDIPHRPDFSFRDDRMLILEIALKHPKITVYNSPALLHLQHYDTRLQSTTGLQQAVQNFQHLNIYKHIIARLTEQNELDNRRASATINILWPLAHWIALDFLDEATKVAEWIYQLDPDFKTPGKGLLAWLYRNSGFKNTEKLLKIRRIIVNAIR